MKSLVCALILITGLSAFGQNKVYTFHLDLTKINDDLLQIKLDVPDIESDKIIYNIPKIIPIRIVIAISNIMRLFFLL